MRFVLIVATLSIGLMLASCTQSGEAELASTSMPALTPTATLEPTPILCKENNMALTPAQQEAFLTKHKALLMKQPNAMGFGYGKLWTVTNDKVVELLNEDGDNKYGLNLQVSKKVDQSTLSESIRISDCLDEVPVNWIEHGEWLMPWDVPSEWTPEQGFASGGKPMGHLQNNHRPLRAGIAIMPSAGPSQRGTLTAVAMRKSDLT